MRIKLAALLLCVSILLLSGCGSVASGELETSADSEVTAFGVGVDIPVPTLCPTTQAPVPESEPMPEVTPETEPTPEPDSGMEEDMDSDARLEEFLLGMTLEEKVAQLFVVTPEALTGGEEYTTAGVPTQSAINSRPVGGIIYMAGNLTDRDQCQTMLANTQSYSMERIGLPVFLTVDEEGGTVTRVSGTGKFDVPYVGDMRDLGDTGDLDAAYSTGQTIGEYLADLGFNVDFAPVADVLSNPENTVVRSRSFGTEPRTVTDMALAVGAGLEDCGVMAVYKHFPGHGATAGDTHSGYAYTDKTLDQLRECELIPFQTCIEEGATCIMVGHIALPNITGDDVPASLSYSLVGDLLRGEMGYDGLVITDAMNMGAIVDQYTSGDAAVRAILAGVDMILMPNDFDAAYQGVLSAVRNGTIPESRIDESLSRILRMKIQMLSED